MTRWYTVAEAAAVMGLSQHSVRGRCHRGTLTTCKVPTTTPGKGAAELWMVSADEVDAEARRMALRKAQKAKGLKHCPGCDGWFKPEEMCQGNKAYCDKCGREYLKEYWHRKRHGWSAPADSGGGSLEEMIGRPPAPEDALKYACLDVAYRHRPPVVVGGVRLSKRGTYCGQCEAGTCYFHPDLTPKELLRAWKVSRGI
jgi:hypothetical protein